MTTTPTKVAPRTPWRSGHCNQSNPPKIHGQCAGSHHAPSGRRYCSCSCHAQEATMTTTKTEAAAPVRLRILPDLIQGSDEWHDQRRGMVTASVVGQLVTTKTLKPAENDTARGLIALLVAERITGYTDPTYISDDMLRGIEDEPRAVEKYGEHYEPVTTVGFMVRDDFGFKIGYSPDGLVGDDGLVEVKSRRQKKHLQTMLADEVPAENIAQLQAGLLVSGREWIDYVSYCGGMPMWTKRVTPDPRWFKAIVEAVAAFEQTAKQMVTDFHEAAIGLPATERTTDLEMVI